MKKEYVIGFKQLSGSLVETEKNNLEEAFIFGFGELFQCRFFRTEVNVAKIFVEYWDGIEKGSFKLDYTMESINQYFSDFIGQNSTNYKYMIIKAQ